MSKISIFSRLFFRLTVPKIFLGESFSVSFISAIKKKWKGWGGSIAILRRSFCLTVTKFFIGEHFGVSENSENFMHRRRGHLRFVVFSFIPAIKKNWKGWGREYRDFARGGKYHKFPSKFFCLTVTKIFRGIIVSLMVFQKNLLLENFMDRRRGHLRFVESFCLTGPK